MRRSLAISLIGMLLAASGVAASGTTEGKEALDVSHFSFFDGFTNEAYALDDEPRHLVSEVVHCDREAMIVHRSHAPRYAVVVHPAFAERLSRFDEFVNALAVEVYGRAPKRLIHRGTFACRSTRANRGRISEHALGNAIDFQGLDFAPLPRSAKTPTDMPARLCQGFSVRVKQHWFPRRERDSYHARFLHRLAEELRAHPEIFRGIVGPPRPRHGDHLHFDAAPWRYSMFGYDVVNPQPRITAGKHTP